MPQSQRGGQIFSPPTVLLPNANIALPGTLIPRFPLVNTPLRGGAFSPRILGPLAMYRLALDHSINGSLESLPSVWMQLDF